MGIFVVVLMVMLLVFMLAINDFGSALAKASVILAVFGIVIIGIVIIMF